MPRRGENIRKRKDGRWEGRYIKSYDLTGKAKYGSVYGKSYYEVKKKLICITEQVSLGTLPDKVIDITLREVLFLWLQSNRLRVKEQTYAKYLYLAEKHIIPSLGELYVKNIESDVLNRYLSEKSENGRLDGDGGLSANYMQTLCFVLRSALDFAAKQGYRKPIIGEIIKPTKQRNITKSIDVLSLNEQRVLENYLTEDIDCRKLGVLISLYTGLRVGEVCGLKWSDIDFEYRTIHIQNTVERIPNLSDENVGSKTSLVLCDVKTVSSNRIIPIPDKLLFLLLKFRNKEKFVVPGNSYQYTDPRTLQNCFHKYLEECNLRHVNFHVLRHTFATHCIEAGVDIKTLSELLGHASVNITLNIYVHSSLEHKRKQLELLSFFRGQNYGMEIAEAL